MIPKARCVADGSMELGGMNFHSAPVPDLTDFRCVLIFCARANWYLKSFDVS